MTSIRAQFNRENNKNTAKYKQNLIERLSISIKKLSNSMRSAVSNWKLFYYDSHKMT